MMSAGDQTARLPEVSKYATRLALAATGVLVWEWVPGQNLVAWGEGVERVYGLGAEELTHERWKTILHPEDADRTLAMINLAVATTSGFEGEYRVYWPDGSVHWVLARGTLTAGRDGEPATLIGVNMDVTARKELEAAQREGQERLKAALAASHTGTFRWDIRTNAVDWDEELDQLFGLRPGESARSLQEFIARVHPEDRAGVIERCEACLHAGADFEMVFRVEWPDGSLHWLYDRGKTYHDADGHASYMTGACVDVTEKVRSEAALRESERDLRMLIDAIPALVGSVDLNLRMRRANRAYEDWFGIPQQDVIGLHIREVLSPERYEKTREYRERALAGEHVTFETELTSQKGMREALVNLIPEFDAQGNVVGFTVLTTDITERKRAEEALRKQEKLAVVGRLASSIAHEINNPLEAVMNLLFLAERAEQEESVREYVRVAQEQLERVTHITTHALRFHRTKTVRAPLELSAVVDSVLAIFDGKLRNVGVRVEKVYRGSSSMVGSENELRQVFANLISNAADAIAAVPAREARRRLVVKVQERKACGRGARVEILVADTGAGMTEDTRRRLFEPFFSTKEDNGAGLGLWISSEIVEKHRGKIKVRSRRGAGTVFCISLPIENGESVSSSRAGID